jgi:hypothetical protein
MINKSLEIHLSNRGAHTYKKKNIAGGGGVNSFFCQLQKQRFVFPSITLKIPCSHLLLHIKN